MIWSVEDSLRWAAAWEECDGPPNGDALALAALAAEVRRLRELKAAPSAKRVERLETALKIIHTWASVDGALKAGDVIDLCRRTLDAR